jgi:hypothetical protein
VGIGQGAVSNPVVRDTGSTYGVVRRWRTGECSWPEVSTGGTGASNRPAAQGSIVMARLVAVRAAPIDLAQQDGDGTFEVSPLTEEFGEKPGDLLV